MGYCLYVLVRVCPIAPCFEHVRAGGGGGGGGSVTVGQMYISNYGPQWWGWVFYVYSPQ